MKSTGPPAGNATTMRTTFSCARAGCAASAPITASISNALRRFMNESLSRFVVLPSVAAHRHATVHHDFGAGDEAGIVGCEKEHCGRGVAAIAHEAQRDACEPLLQKRFDVASGALPGEPCLDHRRVKLSRDHG